ncbi:MAG TPA: ABC transporter substrate-binding protein [Chloroflexota bacterium]|nr:ABC transporter substrate-binding protein [Chloroflexota bacterium]
MLAACAPTRPAAPAAPAPASPAASAPAAPLPSPAQAQPAKVILANASTGAAPQFWASYVADKQGFFAQEGIDFEAVRLQSAPNLTQSLISGDTQAVGFTVLSMATAIAAGAPLKMVVSTQDAPAIELLVAPEIHDWSDLRGKTLGSGNSPGDYFDVALRMMMAANGLRDDEYTARTMPSTARVPALLAGQLAGTLGSDQDKVVATAGGARSLGAFTDYVKDVHYAGLLVNDSWAKANEDTLVRFVRALLHGSNWLFDPANAGAAQRIYADEAGLAVGDIEPLYNDMVTKRLLPRDLRPNRTAIENILTIAHQQGALPEIPPLDSWIDLSYLDKASR